VSRLVEHDVPSARPAYRVERRFVEVGGVRRALRLVRFAAGWVASADAPDGPTLGVNRSPFLAARRALEPLGIGLVEAMEVVGAIADERPTRPGGEG
jgi:hypothetical protein